MALKKAEDYDLKFIKQMNVFKHVHHGLYEPIGYPLA